MKQKINLIFFLAFCATLIVSSLYAGRDAYQHCDKCNFYNHDKKIARVDTNYFLNP